MSFVFRSLLCALVAAGFSSAQEPWELPPILYSETPATDAIAGLAADISSGKRVFPQGDPLDELRFVLKTLEIPVESQLLVFSKTSAQNSRISPATPRSLFFNENAYVGYVQGGSIEIIVHDPLLGVIFYLIEPSVVNKAPVIVRESGSCLSCHGTRRTESVPGMTVRSVHPDERGNLLLTLGSSRTDDRSPIGERWGGYYVTGRSALPHFGNRTFVEADGRQGAVETPPIDSVRARIDISHYLRDTSDIVALMVFEHQCRMHNLLTAASMGYRRVHWIQRSIDPHADPNAGRAGKTADELAAEVVDAMLFKDEAPMGDGGVDGDPAFQKTFAKRFPRTRNGDSLADFQLSERIFKHRCSYMIYSKAFEALPPRVKSAVFARLREVLEQGKDFPGIKPAERRRIAEILRETVPGFG